VQTGVPSQFEAVDGAPGTGDMLGYDPCLSFVALSRMVKALLARCATRVDSHVAASTSELRDDDAVDLGQPGEHAPHVLKSIGRPVNSGELCHLAAIGYRCPAVHLDFFYEQIYEFQLIKCVRIENMEQRVLCLAASQPVTGSIDIVEHDAVGENLLKLLKARASDT
jgi:hypothetical protein